MDAYIHNKQLQINRTIIIDDKITKINILFKTTS